MERKVFGIDLGTTYSAIATLDDNALPQLIENYNDGGNLLASAVYFPEGGSPVVGSSSKSQSEIEPERVVQFVKREIGKPNPQVFEFDGIEYDPITVSSLILKRMKEYAEEQMGEVQDVVITCPAYFGAEEKRATRQAGEIAGLNVLNIVNEPTAAALNYCSREFKENRKIMVYDLGGGTFDITLFDFAVDDNGKASIDVIKTDGDDRLGGIDWDNRLYEYFCKLYADENGLSSDEDGLSPDENMDAELRQILRNHAEDSKKKLSNMPKWNFSINYGGDQTRVTIAQKTFEDITRDLVERTLDFVRRLFSDSGISANEVDTVLLVGGSTKMPMIKAAVKGLFPESDVRVEQPDLAVAKGAALAAAVEFNERIVKLTEKIEEIVVSGGDTEEIGELAEDYKFVAPEIFENIESGNASIADVKVAAKAVADASINVPAVVSNYNDILSKSYGPRVQTGDVQIIDNLLFDGDAAPTEKTETYYTIVDDQRAVLISVYENASNERVVEPYTFEIYEDYDAKYKNQKEFIEVYNRSFDLHLQVKQIGEVTLPMPPNSPKGTPLEVTLIFGTGGLDVIARNPQTNEKVEANIISANTMNREELEQAKRRFAKVNTSGQI